MAALFIGPRKHGQLLSAAGNLVNTAARPVHVFRTSQNFTHRDFTALILINEFILVISLLMMGSTRSPNEIVLCED